jgi:hypothetical protein
MSTDRSPAASRIGPRRRRGSEGRTSAWALHDGVRLPPWSAMSWQLDWRPAETLRHPPAPVPFRGGRRGLLGNGAKSREALLWFSVTCVCPVEGGSISRTNQCDIPARPVRRWKEEWRCYRPGYVGAVINLAPARRIVGRRVRNTEEGVERKKKGEAGGFSPHPHPHPIAAAAGVVENRGFVG